MKIIIILNWLISIVFALCYFYQIIYVFVGLFKKPKRFETDKKHRFAIMISARNEEAVIGNLIDSIKKQNYPEELIDIFVAADNCTDSTAAVAEQKGAYAYERFNNKYVGKGYALDWLIRRIKEDHGDKNYDAYIVFDADNIVSPDFVNEMNKVYSSGYEVVTSYRNSKNYAQNWITAGYSLWFLREAKFLNNSRMCIGTSSAISGTGFLVSCALIEKNGGWIHHLLTEDIEFTTDCIINGIKIGYAEKAVLYDEQPSTMYQSYLQRLRWSKGFYQVFMKYGKRLIQGVFKGSFACYDMLMTLMPAMLLTLLCVVLNVGAIAYGILLDHEGISILFNNLAGTFISFYLVFAFFGVVTTITEWERIYCKNYKKILYIFTFPLFMFTYVPISIIALFKKVSWKPIEHSISTDVDDVMNKV
ncbi:MAG: glycosyltransferase family 2 protein [Clostridia bacterium]|nr:glycosyltransferase family 2 protein [Clostridia bacterium]